MSDRPTAGRALFYTRDSEGHSDLAPPQYVAWARREAARLGVAFAGTPEAMEAMIARGVPAESDLFIDYGISGNVLSRPGFDAFRSRALRDPAVSHLFVPRRDRIARRDVRRRTDRLDVVVEQTMIVLDALAGGGLSGDVPRGHGRGGFGANVDELAVGAAGDVLDERAVREGGELAQEDDGGGDPEARPGLDAAFYGS